MCLYACVQTHTHTHFLNLVVTIEKRTVREVMQGVDNKYLNIHSFTHSESTYEHLLCSRHNAKPWRNTRGLSLVTCLLLGACTQGAVEGEGPSKRDRSVKRINTCVTESNTEVAALR